MGKFSTSVWTAPFVDATGAVCGLDFPLRRRRRRRLGLCPFAWEFEPLALWDGEEGGALGRVWVATVAEGSEGEVSSEGSDLVG